VIHLKQEELNMSFEEDGTENEAGLESDIKKDLQSENRQNIPTDFQTMIELLKQELDYVEDDSFKWKNVVSLLVIKLSETDSKNKVRGKSNATNIAITESRTTQSGYSKTDDFFPTLVVNETFKKWRTAVKARMHKGNITRLRNEDPESGWIEDRIEIKRRPELNAANPVIHICYLDDLDPIRKSLWPNDYLIIAKQEKRSIYEAFGLKSDVSLGNSKKIYVSPHAENDTTIFDLSEVIIEPNSFIRVFEAEIIPENPQFEINENDPAYEVNDEIWVFDSTNKFISYRIEVKRIDEEEKVVHFRIKDKLDRPITLDRMKAIGFTDELVQQLLSLAEDGNGSEGKSIILDEDN